MAYLDIDDYTISISVTHLNEILTAAIAGSGKTAAQVRQDAEDTTEATIRAYTAKIYDMDAEFLLTGSARAKMVVKCMVDISLYTLHMTINPRNIPAIREANYERCITFLDEVKEGKMILIGVDELPEATREDYITVTSQRKFISKPFTDRSILDNDTL